MGGREKSEMSVWGGSEMRALIYREVIYSTSRRGPDRPKISLSLSLLVLPSPLHTYLATGNVHDRMTIRQERQVLPRFGQTTDR